LALVTVATGSTRASSGAISVAATTRIGKAIIAELKLWAHFPITASGTTACAGAFRVARTASVGIAVVALF
jgi:hypothetical protein